jgi:hypothetical protein
MADVPAAYGVVGPERADLHLPDGVTLAADIYRPDAPGRFPALLMRQPYGRKIASTVVLAHPSWYASHGYVVIVQDVRGRGASSGDFRLLADDQADGAATLVWAAEHPACDGRVAMYGFSYQAMTQLLALAGAMKAGTKRPDAIVPAMGGWTIRNDWVADGGCFRLAGGLGWAIQMAVEQARLAGDLPAFEVLMTAAAEVSAGIVRARPTVMPLLERYAAHYGRWLTGDPDAFKIAPSHALEGLALDTPALFVGGWFDIMLKGTLAMHSAFSGPMRRLVIGPWTHLPWSRRPGGVDLGPAACSDIDRDTIRFLDHVLKQKGSPGPKVRLFDIGAKAWIDLDAFPDGDPRTFWLDSSGLAAATSSDGRLAPEPGDGSDTLVHDPWRPAPLTGGCVGQPPGLQDRAALDDRSDVAVYTTAALQETLRLTGRMALELHVSSDMPSHDLHCTISWLDPSGPRSLTLATGHLRVADPSLSGSRRIELGATCASLPEGSRLRISIQAAAWPSFAVNPGTGERPEDAHPLNSAVTTLTIHHAGSRLLLS